jgi:hypothetical protein
MPGLSDLSSRVGRRHVTAARDSALRRSTFGLRHMSQGERAKKPDSGPRPSRSKRGPSPLPENHRRGRKANLVCRHAGSSVTAARKSSHRHLSVDVAATSARAVSLLDCPQKGEPMPPPTDEEKRAIVYRFTDLQSTRRRARFQTNPRWARQDRLTRALSTRMSTCFSSAVIRFK